jgi:hypothetical protein
MAITSNLLLKKLSGSIGKQLVVKQYGDKTVITAFPTYNKRRKPSKGQVQVRELMAEANYRARGIIADEKLKGEAQLRLNVTSNKLYTALVKEYFKDNFVAEKK